MDGFYTGEELGRRGWTNADDRPSEDARGQGHRWFAVRREAASRFSGRRIDLGQLCFFGGTRACVYVYVYVRAGA